MTELRTAQGISQGALAAELGVSRQTVNSIETGRYTPSLPLAFALGARFQLPVEDIFTIEPDDLPRRNK